MLSKFRLIAFLSHLIISVCIAMISLAVVFLVWYPSPLAKAIGATDIYFMMLGIDIILGPLLTLVVAKQGKKSLKFDLSVIAMVQIIALVYGMYTISLNRPSYIAFDTLRFEAVQASDIQKEDKSDIDKAYQSTNYVMPKYVSITATKSDKERADRTFLELEHGIAPSMRPSLYEPLENQWDVISKKSKPLSDLTAFNAQADVDKIMTKYPQATSWQPLKAYEVSMVVLIDDKEIVDIVDLRPW